MKYPYPIKDWRRPEEYVYINSFAWEFLRRSAEYQKDYDHVCSQADEIHAQYEEMHNKAADSSFRAFLHWDEGGQVRRLLAEPFFTKYGFESVVRGSKLIPPPPTEDNFSNLVRLGREFSYQVSGSFVKSYRDSLPTGRKYRLHIKSASQVLVRFDFEDATVLRRQIRTAEKKLLEMNQLIGGKQSRKRANNKTQIERLRVLDALADGVSELEIAKVMYPNLGNTYPDKRASKKVNNLKNAGLELVNGGYKKLIFDDETS